MLHELVQVVQVAVPGNADAALDVVAKMDGTCLDHSLTFSVACVVSLTWISCLFPFTFGVSGIHAGW